MLSGIRDPVARHEAQPEKTDEFRLWALKVPFKGRGGGGFERLAYESLAAWVLKTFVVPPLQRNFVNIFFVFAWEFCIEKRRGFLVNFFWSPFPTKRSTKTPQKFGENSERNSG